MVAKITVPHSITRALNYNEKKMKEGKAECIHAHNYLKDAGRLNYYEKLQGFQQLISLNDRANTNTIHISCLLYTSPSPRDRQKSRMPSSA